MNDEDKIFQVLKKVPYEQLSDKMYEYITKNNIDLMNTPLDDVFVVFGWTLREYNNEYESRIEKTFNRYANTNV